MSTAALDLLNLFSLASGMCMWGQLSTIICSISIHPSALTISFSFYLAMDNRWASKNMLSSIENLHEQHPAQCSPKRITSAFACYPVLQDAGRIKSISHTALLCLFSFLSSHAEARWQPRLTRSSHTKCRSLKGTFSRQFRHRLFWLDALPCSQWKAVLQMLLQLIKRF